METAQTPALHAGAPNMGQDINVGQMERWASLIGGGTLVLYGLSQRSLGGTLLALLGGALVYRGASGHCHVYQTLGHSTASDGAGRLLDQSIHVEQTLTINRSPEDLYHFWRDFKNLPRFMQHLESVTPITVTRSRWVAKAPLGSSVEWEADIVEERQNELIAWRSVEGSDVDNAGAVRFSAAPAGRGTEVKVTLDYTPPGGVLGAAFAKLFGEEPAQQIRGDLRRFKQMMEAGEIATIEGQPSGRGKGSRSEQDAQDQDAVAGSKSIVREASEESFPASDAPGWTSGREDQVSREVGR